MLNANNNAGSGIEELIGSAKSGSPASDPASPTPAGQSDTSRQGGFDYESAYKELESKLGTQGQELGEYRTFVENITPLLEKLDSNPELVRAIVDGQIDQQLVQAVLEGKINPTDAQAVTMANKEVVANVGKDKLNLMTPERVEAMIEARTNEIRKELEQKAELTSFETRTTDFIESTPDFNEYAEEIDIWLDNHNIADIEVAYWAVKGQMSTAQAQKAAEVADTERQKELVLNAGGGYGYSTTAPDGSPLIDKLVGSSANPLYN